MTVSKGEFRTAACIVSERLQLHYSIAEEVVALLFRPAELIRHIDDDTLRGIAKAALGGHPELFKEPDQ